MSGPKTEQLSLRMSRGAKELLRLAAEREHRSVSNMVEHLVLAYCEQYGLALEETVAEKEHTSTRDMKR